MDFLTEPFLTSPERIEGRVLVTGAGGCIGAWVLAILERSGVPVVAADLQDERSRPALIMGADRVAFQSGESAPSCPFPMLAIRSGVESPLASGTSNRAGPRWVPSSA